MDAKDFLKTIHMFAGLSEEELDELSRSVTQQQVTAGTVLAEEGGAGDRLCIIRSGRVRVERVRDGRAVTLAELGPGAFFGEMAIVDGKPHSARVVAAENCGILCISRLDLDVILHWNTALGQRFWRTVAQVLAERLRRSNDVLFKQVSGKEPDVEALRGLIQPE